MMEQQTVKGQFFVAVITDEFLSKSEKYLQIIKSVDQTNTMATLQNKTSAIKPMYVIIKRGVKWTDFQSFPWRQIHFYTTDPEFDKAFDKIKEDVKNWKKIQP
jgi:hypothetical protein